ncbi:amidohydrolase family protein [Echinicola sp. CAU 1574]|uniref:Amidohydrolase family protein n=1 Tax=Echinicola arenosa TaxID=2774144 RepID=A0ABR9ANM9_9BACT|nr:amidohydrolase family protein [Echinicola arenosa]MBD8489962.1 amidohydrolase family protein [Echinicola arenosa]
MKKSLRACLVFFISATLISCQNGKSEQEKKVYSTATVITAVNIIDIHDGSISKGDVVIDSGRIKEILPNLPEKDWEDGELINGEGKYLLPGLAEMHAHIPSVMWNDPQMEETLFLYLSNGVTTIRGMLGHPLHLELRTKAANNEILSPRIYTSSPSLNGNTVTSPEMAKEMVTNYQKEGYDFLKLHPGIRLHVFDEIVKTAKEVGIPYAGHVSTLVGIRHALESGYASVDHIDGFLEGLVPESAHVNPTENGFFGYNFTEKADPDLIAELAQMAKENKVWVVPTQSLFTRWFSPTPTERLAEEPEMQYMAKEVIENWVNNKNNLTESEDYDAGQWEDFMLIRKQLIKALHKNGYGLLLGSDAPQVFNVPGFSIQHELQAMVDAGLSPLEALQIGTLNPAKYFHQEGHFGEIIEGASADLILLDQNPLKDIKNMQHPAGVMVRGKWLSRETIDQKLKALSDKFKEATP